ncbi:unnamed protein product [Brassica oleracea var. botrytis]|uniref:(rape) hypothetical protein n=1 Tax=Brassica napus TaxID=3708 RepID=A0A078JSN6_BRANA|nr:unnamed protein product [Brassica napus]CAF2002511.1 unnamed protein product [Brassica napus]CAF2002540.1 unnamed protein product [Brassica napus]CDY69425.1 BnaAnng30460D [Brassica napus]
MVLKKKLTKLNVWSKKKINLHLYFVPCVSNLHSSNKSHIKCRLKE